jgi:hypothetical protein
LLVEYRDGHGRVARRIVADPDHSQALTVATIAMIAANLHVTQLDATLAALLPAPSPPSALSWAESRDPTHEETGPESEHVNELDAAHEALAPVSSSPTALPSARSRDPSREEPRLRSDVEPATSSSFWLSLSASPFVCLATVDGHMFAGLRLAIGARLHRWRLELGLARSLPASGQLPAGVDPNVGMPVVYSYEDVQTIGFLAVRTQLLETPRLELEAGAGLGLLSSVVDGYFSHGCHGEGGGMGEDEWEIERCTSEPGASSSSLLDYTLGVSGSLNVKLVRLLSWSSTAELHWVPDGGGSAGAWFPSQPRYLLLASTGLRVTL